MSEVAPTSGKAFEPRRAATARPAGDRPIRVLLYVKGFPPRETGGPVEVAFHVARGLLVDGRHRLTLVVQTDSREAEVRAVLGNLPGLAVLRLPYFPAAREVLALPRVVRAFAAADIIHFNEFPFRHIPLVLLAKARGAPVVFSMHGLLSQEIHTFLGPNYPFTIEDGNGSLRVPLPRAARLALLSAYRFLSRVWTAVIVPSEALKRDATSLEHFSAAKISVIPHGVEVSEATHGAAKPHDGPPRILFVGKLETIKGPDLLLDAVGRLRTMGVRVDVSIVGAGSLEDTLRDQAAAMGLGQVAFLGARRGENLQSIYAASDIVAIPSRHESLSLVLLEAMAAGRSIVATKVGGIPEIASDPRNALLVNPDSQALAEALRQLIEQPGLRASMAEANRLDARRRAWPNVVARYVRLYGELLSGRRRVATGPA